MSDYSNKSIITLVSKLGYFKYQNFFFLTNNYFFQNNFCTGNIFLINLKKNKIKSTPFLNKQSGEPLQIKIFKNWFFSIKFLNLFNLFLQKKKNLFKFFFKNNLIFKFIYTKKLKKFKNLNLLRHLKISKFYPKFFKNYFQIEQNSWYFITGKPIHSLLTLPYILSYKNLNFYSTFLNEKNKNILTKYNFNLLFKKLIINHFFYFNKINSNFADLKILFKFNSKDIKKELKILLHNIYFFLNNEEFSKLNTTTYDLHIYKLFKNFSKFFNIIKKIRYKKKLLKSQIFKYYKFYYNMNNFQKLTQNVVNKNNVQNKFNIFKFKNYKNFFKLLKFKKILNNLKKQKYTTFSKSFFLLKFSIIYKTFFFKYTFIKNRRIKKKKLQIWTKISKLYSLSNFTKINTKLAVHNAPTFNLKNFFFYNQNLVNLFNFIDFFFYNSIDLEKKSFEINRVSTKSKNYFEHYKYNKFENLVLATKEKTPFILYKHGFLYITETTLNKNLRTKTIYNLKKTLYSFLYKNELQKYILKRYFKMQVYDFYLTDNTQFFFNTSLNFENNDNSSPNTSHLQTLLTNSGASKIWTFFDQQFHFWKNYSEEISNFTIKRIRFKPGYMSLWREAREVLKVSLNLKIKYQFRLTRYLFRYYKFIKFKTFLILEFQLLNILTKSKLFPDYGLTLLFFNNTSIFVNGSFCFNPNFQLFVGDFIQLVISFKYYVLHKWLLVLNLKKKNKLKNVSKKKLTIPENYEEKQKSHTFPNWILFNKNIVDDITKYVEVDYFTLSFFIVYEPFLWSDLNFYNIKETRFGIINLYNWKYIT